MVRGSTPAEVTAAIRASGFKLFCFTKCSLATTTAAAPSVMPEEFPAEIVPGSFDWKTPEEVSPAFPGLPPANGCSSRANTVVPFLPSIVTGSNLCLEASGGNGARGARLRHQRELVLLVAGDLVLLGENLGRLSHEHLRQRTEKSVAIHAVDEFLIAQAISPARPVEIIRKPRHRLRATRENAACDRPAGWPDKPARSPSCPTRRLCSPCMQELPAARRCERKSAAPDSALRQPGGRCRRSSLRFARANAGALDRRFGRDDAHVGRRQTGQRSAKFPDRRPNRRENIDGLQGCLQTFEFSRIAKDSTREQAALAIPPNLRHNKSLS